jgi:hypothetical protein
VPPVSSRVWCRYRPFLFAPGDTGPACSPESRRTFRVLDRLPHPFTTRLSSPTCYTHARRLFLLLLLWIFGDQLARIDSATTALFGLSVLVITGVLTWKDILHEEGAWDTLVWFAALVMMANFLNELGLIPWFTKSAQGMVGGSNGGVAFLVLCLVYFYSHYLFGSQTAHVSSMYAAFLSASVAVGTPASSVVLRLNRGERLAS